MNDYEKGYQCRRFFKELADILGETHYIVGSCNQDETIYLLEKGTDERELSYYSKPKNSYRISDHWSWYSNVRKNPDETYIQCESVDVPNVRERIEPGKASKPRKAWQVCFFGEDGKYHCIFGDIYDKETKTWSFKTVKAKEVLK